MAVFTAATTTHLLLRHLLHRPPPFSTATPFSLLRPRLSFSLLPLCSALSASTRPEFDEFDNHKEDIQMKSNVINGEIRTSSTVLDANRKLPNLTVKEKKELGSYAHSLGDKLKSQQVGKSGVTDNLVFALNETLEANELLKLKIHRSCPGDLEEVVRQLEQATGSIVVGQIGRTVILYRPSISKLKAEEKKEENRRLFAQRRRKTQTAFMKRKTEQLPRRPGRFARRRVEKVPS